MRSVQDTAETVAFAMYLRSAHNSIYILITFNCNLLIEISTNILSFVWCAIENERRESCRLNDLSTQCLRPYICIELYERFSQIEQQTHI